MKKLLHILFALSLLTTVAYGTEIPQKTELRKIIQTPTMFNALIKTIHNNFIYCLPCNTAKQIRYYLQKTFNQVKKFPGKEIAIEDATRYCSILVSYFKIDLDIVTGKKTLLENNIYDY